MIKRHENTPPGRFDDPVKRSALLAARLRFSPTGGTLRDQALEHIIEQNIAASNSKLDGVTENELKRLLSLDGKISILRSTDLSGGLVLLQKKNRIITTGGGVNCRYALSPAAAADVADIISRSESRVRSALRELFGDESSYRDSFFHVLNFVFASLGEAYAEVISNAQSHAHFCEHELLNKAISQAAQTFSLPDVDAFRMTMKRFFSESTPVFDDIKWNMAQNYYVARVLGIEDAAALLSADFLKGASIYCDTNVIINAVAPGARQNGSFQELSDFCAKSGISMKYVHITREELRNAIDRQADLMKRTIEFIPDATLDKVESFLLEPFLTARRARLDLDVDSFAREYKAKVEAQLDRYPVSLEDDKWFVSAEGETLTSQISTDLSRLSRERRGRPKHPLAAKHDALLLRWIEKRNTAGDKSWLLTLDSIVVGWTSPLRNANHRTTTLDALLQWTTPAMADENRATKLAEIFSHALRYQLLPRETFFTLADFQVFADMGIQTRQLPAEDVEACLKELQKAAVGLDPTKAEDREKLQVIAQRFFVDPGTRINRTLQDKGARIIELERLLESEMTSRRQAEESSSALSAKHELQRAMISEQQTTISQNTDRIVVLERALRDIGARDEARIDRKIFWVRTTACGLALVASWAVLALIAVFFGDGVNWFQRLTASWAWFGGVAAAVAVSYRFVLGARGRRGLSHHQGHEPGNP